MTTPDDGKQRMQIQELGGALLKLNATDATAAALLTKLFQVVAEEAAQSKRFAKALAGAFAVSAVSGGEPIAEVVAKPPVRKKAAPKKVIRQAGQFDPFDIYRDSGEEALAAKLAELNLEQLRDIIAEQEIDIHKETRLKRKPQIVADWVVERVKLLANKGSVFR
ncbi:hypothetical protein [Rhodococcus sp. 14-2483-1-2]|jgi:hypothetical protein|uniref:hypothetical protein n=1 Tax=Rhodococcus sp. 14-2483-1-2 TaxID=2023147 RepID=UPI000B9B152C|nr:hypothetical protein [Rhodococcus sp. 14-2483-1-2]OZF29342.1 hypothetical protein CH295_17415 [Rhodococcus sp. 14-2483-1-2]